MWVERYDRGQLELGALAQRLGVHGGLAWLDGEGLLKAGWSFLGCAPVDVVRATFADQEPLARLTPLDADPRVEHAYVGPAAGDALPPLARVPRHIGYLAYDAAFALEPHLAARHQRDPASTTLHFARYDALLAVDHERDAGFLLADNQAAARGLRERLDTPLASTASVSVSEAWAPPPERHAGAIRAALEHIAAGDFYQVNLARRWTAKYSGDPLLLFLAMRRASPVPLGAYLDAGDHAVLARTMETFLRWERDTRELSTRPIKGTIPRRDDMDEDERVAGLLRADAKEHAEHAMIVDLMRNDLARVAETGSVRVTAPFSVEPYARLSHLVTTIAATTRPEVGLVDILRATFPPGSVTGAPKLAAMRAIEALEPEPRGVYCGAIGHLDQRGGLSLAVAIRTALAHADVVHYYAGGGLVAASDPEREVAETELKARVFLDALDELRRR
ncbi:MAG: anthranilate synthase component I family protein [Sandaracinaceae bacterium]|jgi:anthranilate/para-aminobenzoate synthase component I|nr:anthranilate synthase component I family protein [Sandaracinaceae bacterium]MBK8588733.1 anthranilate synthase component I family protein [Sandaracinaceae bacterium]MBP7684984.1 anthranilate synthase component I family protein [Deltaproteobacteria bacterium]